MSPRDARSSGVVGLFLMLLGLVTMMGFPGWPTGTASADTANPPTDTKVSTPTQSNVAPGTALTGLVNGTTLTITVTAKAGNEGKFFGADARLCKSGATITNSASFAPSQSGNCIDKPANSQSDDFVTGDARPQNTTVTFPFRVGVGSWTMNTSLNGTQSFSCDGTHACALWLRQQVDTTVVTSGNVWIHYDLQFAPSEVASTTASVASSSSTLAGATTSSTAPGATTSSTAAGGSTSTTTTTSTTSMSTTSTSVSGSSTTSTIAPTSAGFTISPTPAAAGGSISITSAGWQASSTVNAVLHSDPVTLGSLTASATGELTGSLQLPAGTETGAHSLTLTGTGADGTARELRADLTVTAADESTTTSDPATGALARTGAAIGHIAWNGAALFVAGYMLLIAAVRRQRHALRDNG